MENKKSLETTCRICQTPDPIQGHLKKIHLLFTIFLGLPQFAPFPRYSCPGHSCLRHPTQRNRIPNPTMSHFFPRDELRRMEELSVGACSHLIHHCGLQVHHDGPVGKYCISLLSGQFYNFDSIPWNVLSRTCLREEGGEGIV